jgi:hypothetical protein
MKQASTEKLFKSISKYALDAPVVVIATKRDQFLDIAEGEAKRMLRGKGLEVTTEACEQHAEEKLQGHLLRLQEDIINVGGRFDACVATSMCMSSQVDRASVSTLLRASRRTRVHHGT